MLVLYAVLYRMYSSNAIEFKIILFHLTHNYQYYISFNTIK